MSDFERSEFWTSTELVAGPEVVLQAAQWFGATEAELHELPAASHEAWARVIGDVEDAARNDITILSEIARLEGVSSEYEGTVYALGRIVQLAILEYRLRERR